MEGIIKVTLMSLRDHIPCKRISNLSVCLLCCLVLSCHLLQICHMLVDHAVHTLHIIIELMEQVKTQGLRNAADEEETLQNELRNIYNEVIGHRNSISFKVSATGNIRQRLSNISNGRFLPRFVVRNIRFAYFVFQIYLCRRFGMATVLLKHCRGRRML